ncbi:MAG: hypothetical protein ACRYFU_26315 [Janthinobacterium lividum]
MREKQDLLSAPITVPPDFVGVHAHRWPMGDPVSPAPAYSFGAARSHDYDGAAWYRIHTAPQTFDWSRLDRWVEVHAAATRTLIYTLFGTPAWAASSPEQVDRYGMPGGASPPRDLASVATFVRALAARYNGDGNQRIQWIEAWNEPTFDEGSGGFWWGSAEQLAAMTRVVAIAARQVDPGIRVLSPGFAGDLAGRLKLSLPRLAQAQGSPMLQFLTAADGHGGKGSDWCDGIAFHCYNSPLQGSNAGFLLEILRVQKMLALSGISLPLYDTEFGFLADDAFHRSTRGEQATALRRCAAIQAASGVRSLFFYAHDDDLVGNPSLHPEVGQAIGDVHGMMAGKTLKQVTLLPDGSVHVATTERTFTW